MGWVFPGDVEHTKGMVLSKVVNEGSGRRSWKKAKGNGRYDIEAISENE
jgi:hypothetical protein